MAETPTWTAAELNEFDRLTEMNWLERRVARQWLLAIAVGAVVGVLMVVGVI